MEIFKLIVLPEFPGEPEQIEKVDTEGFKSLIDRYSKYWSHLVKI